VRTEIAEEAQRSHLQEHYRLSSQTINAARTNAQRLSLLAALLRQRKDGSLMLRRFSSAPPIQTC